MFSTYDESTRVEHVYSHEDSYRDTAVNAASQLQVPSGLLVVEFPGSSSGQRRRKREWVIPFYNMAENESGDFPKKMFQLKAKIDGVPDAEIVYSITGEGADQPPVGIFYVNKKTGYIYVTQPLDREKKASYELKAHAISEDGKKATSPTNLTIIVIDQNDNRPVFTENPFNGQVSEAESKGYEFMKVIATDADEPDNQNSEIRYRIVSQLPPSPNPNMFEINTITGGIYVNSSGLDKEQWPRYTLLIVAADLKGGGYLTTGTAVITITDSNDNPPQFEQLSHTVSVPENKVGHEVAKLTVTDGDEVGSPAWSTKYRIISGDKGGFFNVSTGPSQLEGIITTVKPLDFEKTKQYVLSVIVENDEPFVGSLPTSTATVTVNVEDVNEPPEFNPQEKVISRRENLPVDSNLFAYIATDPDTGKSQKITYKIGKDPVGWLNVNQDTGMIKVKQIMDRESVLVKDGKYRAIILALDDDGNLSTGTGTLIIELEDENDNAPIINEGSINICNREATVFLSITDKDGPLHAAPFSVEPQGDTKKNWTARMNETSKDNLVYALFTTVLLLLLLLFIRRKSSSIKNPLLLEDDDIRDNVCCYNEEGGGEDDQNLKTADEDPTAPPYDSLLVFDYEGGGSIAGSLSSINSSSSGQDQDYDFLNDWGPRFKKLADMFGGGED
uniref:Cadherin-1 n=1 Tax=Cyprinus carpio TaxID=7962 RepID=A0A8C1QTG0_CYPCA